jgi:hypothetical protein
VVLEVAVGLVVVAVVLVEQEILLQLPLHREIMAALLLEMLVLVLEAGVVALLR